MSFEYAVDTGAQKPSTMSFEYAVDTGAQKATLRISREGLVWGYRDARGELETEYRVDAILTMGPQVSFAIPMLGYAHVYRLAGRAVHDPVDFEFADSRKGYFNAILILGRPLPGLEQMVFKGNLVNAESAQPEGGPPA